MSIRREECSEEDLKWMREAIDLAARSVDEDDRVHPRVGVIIVRDGERLIGSFRGQTGAGGDHAERCALQALGDRDLTGAVVYTTLEPCSQRTLPRIACADRLIERNVGSVFIGIYDPNPKIFRKGWNRLRDAGILLRDFEGSLREEIEMQNSEFIGQFRGGTGIKGSAAFDPLQNSGLFTIADDSGGHAFETRWAGASHGVAHVYYETDRIGLAKYATGFDDIDDPGALHFSGYYCTVPEDQIVVFKNEDGFALVRLVSALLEDRGDSRNEIAIEWELRLSEH